MPAAWGVDRYRQWLTGQLLAPALEERRRWILEHLPELQGDVIGMCWCVDWDGQGEPPGLCHVEVLLELANV